MPAKVVDQAVKVKVEPHLPSPNSYPPDSPPLREVSPGKAGPVDIAKVKNECPRQTGEPRFSARTEKGEKQCTNCAEVDTPQWRGSLCNACALWKRSRGTDRPLPLLFPIKKRARSPSPDSDDDLPDHDDDDETEDEPRYYIGGRLPPNRELFTRVPLHIPRSQPQTPPNRGRYCSPVENYFGRNPNPPHSSRHPGLPMSPHLGERATLIPSVNDTSSSIKRHHWNHDRQDSSHHSRSSSRQSSPHRSRLSPPNVPHKAHEAWNSSLALPSNVEHPPRLFHNHPRGVGDTCTVAGVLELQHDPQRQMPHDQRRHTRPRSATLDESGKPVERFYHPGQVRVSTPRPLSLPGSPQGYQLPREGPWSREYQHHHSSDPIAHRRGGTGSARSKIPAYCAHSSGRGHPPLRSDPNRPDTRTSIKRMRLELSPSPPHKRESKMHIENDVDHFGRPVPLPQTARRAGRRSTVSGASPPYQSSEATGKHQGDGIGHRRGMMESIMSMGNMGHMPTKDEFMSAAEWLWTRIERSNAMLRTEERSRVEMLGETKQEGT